MNSKATTNFTIPSFTVNYDKDDLNEVHIPKT